MDSEKEFESSSDNNTLHQSEINKLESESSSSDDSTDDIICEQLTSPTSCLDPEELERLEERITKANQLLLNLALSKGSERETILINSVLEKTFKRMKGIKFIIDTNAYGDRSTDKEVKGIVNLIGKDFLSLKRDKQEKFIPYHAIASIKHRTNFGRKEPEESLLHLEPCERQELVLKFGKSVASSPTLFDIFLGRSLYEFLLMQKERFITIRTGKEKLTGYIKAVNENKIIITNDNIDEEITLQNIQICHLL